MITLTNEDRRFYTENAPALISYMKYVEYVISNAEKFGGKSNVVLALQIGKFIGRNEIDPKEFDEVKSGVEKLCKGKAPKIMNVLQDKDRLRDMLDEIISSNPKSYMVVSEKGEILRDKLGNPIPNLMKVSIALARELSSES